MIDLTREQALRLDEIAKLVPPSRGAGHTHVSTVYRWIVRGATTPSGRRVRLDATRIGGKWVSSREALLRFQAQLTPPLDHDIRAPQSATARRRASERAEAELARVGI